MSWQRRPPEVLKQNPHFSFMIVPGEFAVLKLGLEKGKVPVVKWEMGGRTCFRDFVRLNYDLLTPEEEAYNQLMVDNIIQGEIFVIIPGSFSDRLMQTSGKRWNLYE